MVVNWVGLSDISSSVQTYMTIQDAEADDRIYWNGHQLTGGVTTIADLEITGSYQHSATIAAIDSNSVVYRLVSNFLTIVLPDGGQVFDNDFHNGDIGIVFDEMWSSWSLSVTYDGNGDYLYYTSNVGISNIAFDSDFENFDDLTGVANAISNPGSFSEPLVPLI